MRKGLSMIFLFILIAQGTTSVAQDSIQLSLHDVFSIADNSSRKLKLDAINLKTAATNITLTKNQQLPDINVSLAAGYLTNVGVIGLDAMKSGFYKMPHFTNSFVLQASYLLFSDERVEKDIEIAKLQHQVAGLNLEKDRQEIKLLLASYYLDLYRLTLQRKVYKQNIGQAELMLEKINNRLNAGIALKSDKIRSELLLEDMKLQLLKLNNNILILNNAMLETLSLPVDIIIVPQIEFDSNYTNVMQLEGMMAEAFQIEPSLQISRLNITTAEKKQRQVKATYLPEAFLYLNNGLARPFVYDIPARDIYANNLNIGVKLNYSIGKLYKNKARMQLAKNDIETASEQAEIIKENSRKGIFNAYVRFKEANEQLASETKKLELATENYRRIANSYDQQLALITDITDASIQKLDAELRVTTSRIAIMMRYYELQKVTGELN